MHAVHNSQELARQFNEDEAVWWSFEQRRGLRRRVGGESALTAEILDALDWQEAEREVRVTRALAVPMETLAP